MKTLNNNKNSKKKGLSQIVFILFATMIVILTIIAVLQ